MKPTKKLSPKTKAVICTVLTVFLMIFDSAGYYMIGSNYTSLCIIGWLMILLRAVASIFVIYLIFIYIFDE